MLAPLLGAVPIAAAQETEGAAVLDVSFEGLQRTTEAFARSIVRVHTGDVFSAAEADADVTRLLASRRFSDASYRADVEAEGVVVTYTVTERPVVQSISFEGAARFKENKLAEQVPIKPGEPVDLFAAREGADAILLMYRDKGLGRARVTYDEDLFRETGELVYTIEEGPRIRVRSIEFEGNSSYSNAELTKHVTTKTYLWIFRDGKFDEDTVEADAASVQSYYRSQGYLDCRVSYRLEFAANQEDVSIAFTIVEGTRYSVESIRFEGNTVFNDAELEDMMSLEVTAPMLSDRLERDVRAIREKYGSNGYIDASVRAERVFSETPGLVQVIVDIDEGEQFVVGHITPRGNERTKGKVVRREFDLYPGDILDISKAHEAEQNLRATQLFDDVRVTPVGDQPGTRDLLVNVEEARKAGDFVFGFGVTSNSGLVGSVLFDFKNFDLFRPPRDLKEFLKLRSFYGAGQRLRIEAQPGSELNRFRIDFTEPYLMDQDLRFDYSAYYFDRGRDAYSERRIGTSVSFGRRIKRSWLKDWYGELSFRLEGVRIADLDVFTARDIRDDEGNSILTGVKVALVRDRTDSRFLPTRGDRFRLSYEQFGILGGEDFFGKVVATYARHWTMHIDNQDRKSVLSLKGTLGAILGDAPIYERFYAGGIGSIRGFQFRGVSPRQGLRDDAVGGDFMALLSAEYSFPLYGELLRGVVFTDMGTVEPSFDIKDWRASIGAGLRMQLDFFGPIPLEFDVAAPVLRESEDEDQVFSFFVGATF